MSKVSALMFSPNIVRIRNEWRECRKCPIGELAHKKVHLDTIPEDTANVHVILVGEGPGTGEDHLGKPFVGPAGKFLRDTLNYSINRHGLSVGFANLVACRPTDIKFGANRAPNDAEVCNCTPRLGEILYYCAPLVIGALGVQAREQLPKILDSCDLHIQVIHAFHPSYLQRTGGKNAPQFSMWVAALQRIFDEANLYVNADAKETGVGKQRFRPGR